MTTRLACSRAAPRHHIEFLPRGEREGSTTQITKGKEAYRHSYASHRPWANMLQSWIIGSSVPDFGSYTAKHDNKSACKLMDQCSRKAGQRKTVPSEPSV